MSYTVKNAVATLLNYLGIDSKKADDNFIEDTKDFTDHRATSGLL